MGKQFLGVEGKFLTEEALFLKYLFTFPNEKAQVLLNLEKRSWGRVASRETRELEIFLSFSNRGMGKSYLKNI